MRHAKGHKDASHERIAKVAVRYSDDAQLAAIDDRLMSDDILAAGVHSATKLAGLADREQ